MWVADRYGEPAAKDLTARARIRDAALVQFADHGVSGATIRGIAEAAGVSPGLVRHHFGSKDQLRKACDAYALEITRRTKDEAVVKRQLGEPGFVATALRATAPVLRYLARALVDGSPAAATLFDELVGYTEEFVRRVAHDESVVPADPHAYAAVLAAMQLGLIVLHPHLSRVLGKDIFSPEGHQLAGRAMLEIYSRALISPDVAESAFGGYRPG